MRAFLALPVSEPAKTPLLQRVDAMRRELRDVRWAQMDTVHLTLHFWSDIELSRVPELEAAVREITKEAAPFGLQISRLGAFPSNSRPRVLWMGLREVPDALKDLFNNLESAIASLGYELEEREFQPHITVARTKPGFDRHSWTLIAEETLELPAWTADEIILYESRGGHRVHSRFALGG